jgi:small-conductance mechanosensitive channel
MRRKRMVPLPGRYRKSVLPLVIISVKEIFLVLFLLLSVMSGRSLSAAPESMPSVVPNEVIETAPVMIDDYALFPVRGIRAYPAAERARVIAERIRKIASDHNISVEAVAAIEADTGTNIVANDYFIMKIVDADAALEGITRQQLGQVYARKIQTAVLAYRTARTSENIIRGILYGIGATIALVIMIILISRLFRRVVSALELSSKKKIRSLGITSLNVFGAEEIWTVINDALRMVRFIIVFVLVYFYLEGMLSFFPWTRHFAIRFLDYVMDPLKVIGTGILKQIPDLMFIAVLVIIVRLALKFLHIFFKEIEIGTRTLAGFYPEWAKPTDRIITLLVIVFAAVVAFPYIPGSNTAAFKGISLFIGVLFSLGSQSTVANTIAGFVVHYRRAFKIGDRIKVMDIIGDVTAITMQVTQLQTIKNEEVIVPNSAILNSHIINYTSLARKKGLILHTEVTIGYDAPWRQVHEMLLMAAHRTNGLMKEPPPFVLQKSLDDFYVKYELNAYTDAPEKMAAIYSELHRNIQDAFNQYGVQIMSPHYLGDPATAKIVPKDSWFKSPAQQQDETESEKLL